ncbi:hypothetical protein L6452_36215 [Arctium lappa]|uniref:Uncharacterized protein n=1 Tax=Arctium lappa TaxID=4217 RepID=A0ACB8Y8J2_ARCLA|nr:hypothetical protein L6452_36215 [Arctium lappa]
MSSNEETDDYQSNGHRFQNVKQSSSNYCFHSSRSILSKQLQKLASIGCCHGQFSTVNFHMFIGGYENMGVSHLANSTYPRCHFKIETIDQNALCSSGLDREIGFIEGCLGDLVHRYIAYYEFSPEYLLDCLDLSSEHQALDHVEASIYIWREKSNMNGNEEVTNKHEWGVKPPPDRTTVALRSLLAKICGKQMDKGTNNGGGGGGGYWWWAAASGIQLVWGIYSFRRGYSGDSRLMPLKAFGVASLFVGATATATIGTINASGIHSVQDAVDVGASIRSGLGVKGRG